MALIVKDRVKESTTTTGTTDFVLGGAASGFQTFAVIGNGNTTYYAAVDQATGDWEVGIGTYSSTGPTLTRDTVLESSNSGSKVSFAAGSKDVFCTYPAERAVYLSAAGLAVDVLDIGTLGTSTANITTANITAGTVSTTPTSGNDLANKTYVDNMTSAGITYHAPVRVEAPTNLNATYNNGTAGVGATLTNAGTQAALVIDGVTVSVNDRVLVYQQTTQTQNGIYTVTNVGSGSTNWVLTRATDADTYAIKSPNGLGQGDAFFVQQGSTGAGETYVCNTVGTITFGTTNITFVQVSSAQIYSAGTGLTLTGTQFSITPVGTASTYGSASQVPVFTTNASGQVSSVTNTAIAISSAAVSGLAASATTDTTDATNITSGTLNSARLNGSYTGITGVGTLTAGTWNGSTIGAGYGGTGQSSYTIGDILYADGTTSLAKLADVATGNALISGGVGTAPAWGKIGLQTHVNGTLQVTNGGTGATTLTGYVYGNGTGAMTASTTIPNSATTATSANTASAIVARDGSGNFSAGTITASLSGNASTATSATSATTATNLAGGVAGAVPYQSGSGATAFSAAGTSGQYLQSNGTSAPSWVTPPTIGDGTLTMNVSGTGLSGSASFTANQTGNSTFTVTSNATSANTASTIVARDASGNFSAGTITATLSGNASSATTASQIDGIEFRNGDSSNGANPDTINNNGTGYVTSVSLFGQTDGALYSQAYSTSWVHQIFGDYRTGQLAVRGRNSGTLTSWRAVLDSSNYTSYIDAPNKAGTSYYQANTWIQFNGTYGLYWPSSGSGTHWNPNTTSSYTGFMMQGSKNGYGGFYDSYSAVNGVMYDSGGNGGVYREANGRWYWYHNVGNNCMGIGTSSTSSTYGIYVTKGIYTDGLIRAGTNVYTDTNYGYGVVGLYNSTIFQGVFAMGDAYKLTAGGGINNLYGMTWSYPSAGGIAGNLSSHGMIVAINGGFGSCMSYNVTASGNVTAYSDERLKKNWEPLCDNFVEKLSEVKVGTYERIDQPVVQVGVSAQSLEKVLPEAVATSNDDMQTKQVAYGNAALASAVMLAKEIVELKRMVKQMQVELAELKRGA